MANALPGLQDLYQQFDQASAGIVDEGVLWSRSGLQTDSADRHAHPGDTSGESYPAGFGVGYKGQPTYYQNDGEIIADFDYPGCYFAESGRQLDDTPSSHGGKWPRARVLYNTMTPDDLALVGEEIGYLHGTDEGAVGTLLQNDPAGHEEPTNYTTERYDAPNENYLASVPGQVKGSGQGFGGSGTGGHLGTSDITQGYGALNDTPEFQMGHSIRREQHDHMPWDYTLLHGEEGPWLGKHPLGVENRFDGPDSPYDVMGYPQQIQMAEVRGFPTEYNTPPDPTVMPTVDTAGSDVFAYG